MTNPHRISIGPADARIALARWGADDSCKPPALLSHGTGFVIIAIATVLLAPVMEELFFRGLLLKALVRLFTKLGAAGGARAAGVVLAVIVDGLLFGLAHGEWVQLAGLAVFGMILAAVSYRTGRLGMNMVAHASFNLVAIIAIVANGSGVIH